MTRIGSINLKSQIPRNHKITYWKLSSSENYKLNEIIKFLLVIWPGLSKIRNFSRWQVPGIYEVYEELRTWAIERILNIKNCLEFFESHRFWQILSLSAHLSETAFNVDPQLIKCNEETRRVRAYCSSDIHIMKSSRTRSINTYNWQCKTI